MFGDKFCYCPFVVDHEAEQGYQAEQPGKHAGQLHTQNTHRFSRRRANCQHTGNNYHSQRIGNFLDEGLGGREEALPIDAVFDTVLLDDVGHAGLGQNIDGRKGEGNHHTHAKAQKQLVACNHCRKLIRKINEGKHNGKNHAGNHQHILFAVLLAEANDHREQAQCHADGGQHHQKGLGFGNIQQHGNVIQHRRLEEGHGNIAEQVTCKEGDEAFVFENALC